MSVSLVRYASVRIDGPSVCAKARGSPAACGVAALPPIFSSPPPHLGHDTEDGVMAADARADLLVVLLGVAHLVELRLKTHTKGPLALPVS